MLKNVCSQPELQFPLGLDIISVVNAEWVHFFLLENKRCFKFFKTLWAAWVLVAAAAADAAERNPVEMQPLWTILLIVI